MEIERLGLQKGKMEQCKPDSKQQFDTFILLSSLANRPKQLVYVHPTSCSRDPLLIVRSQSIFIFRIPVPQEAKNESSEVCRHLLPVTYLI